MSRNHVASVLALAAFTVPAAAFGAGTLLWQDNFNSYADQAAMLGVYNGSGSVGTTGPLSSYFDLGVPTPDGGNTTQSLRYHDMPSSGSGVPDAARDINPTSIKPADVTPIVFQYDFYWDGGGNKRTTSGIRNVGGTPAQTGIIEMGYYNSAYNPSTTAAGAGFAIRTVLITGSGGLPESASLSGWRLMMLDSNPASNVASAATAGSWLTFKALIRGHSVEYTVDVNRDGTVESTYVASVAGPNPLDVTNSIFNNVRFGGPSGLSSGGGGGYFDNILLKTLVTGDLNGDGTIGPDDYALIDRGFALQPASPRWSDGDLNGDHVVDAADYLLIDTAYGQQAPAPAGLLAARSAQFGADYVGQLIAAIPEPVLTAPLALAAAALRRRRRVSH